MISSERFGFNRSEYLSTSRSDCWISTERSSLFEIAKGGRGRREVNRVEVGKS